jgi:hypothetical protein
MLNVIMVNVIMLNVIMFRVIMLSVVILNVIMLFDMRLFNWVISCHVFVKSAQSCVQYCTRIKQYHVNLKLQIVCMAFFT